MVTYTFKTKQKIEESKYEDLGEGRFTIDDSPSGNGGEFTPNDVTEFTYHDEIVKSFNKENVDHFYFTIGGLFQIKLKRDYCEVVTDWATPQQDGTVTHGCGVWTEGVTISFPVEDGAPPPPGDICDKEDGLQPLAAWDGQETADADTVYQVIFDGQVYRNDGAVSSSDCPADAASNAWKDCREATAAELSEHGNPTQCEPGKVRRLLQDDHLTTEGYGEAKFEADGSGTNLSYTSTRVAKSVYNKYKVDPNPDPSKPKLSAYITDWAQYDERLTTSPNQLPPTRYGRGFDLAKIAPTAYDKLIFSFMAICGDTVPSRDPGPDGLGAKIKDNCDCEGYNQGQITITDFWGDLATVVNVNNPDGNCNTLIGPGCGYVDFYNQEDACGVLGGLRNLQREAEAQQHTLELAFSVGGWSLSSYFSVMAADPTMRQAFVDSTVDFFNDFPMFSGIDIDWEYPGSPGERGNVVDEANDGENYALLIGELRTALDEAFGAGTKTITIAAAAVVEKIDTANIPGLIKAGLDYIFLMTYDFFGSWVPEQQLGHHTNLKTYTDTEEYQYSIEKALDHLVKGKDEGGLGVDPGIIHIGYANYGRSAAGADLESGKFDAGVLALGSFEATAPEFYDVLYNYLDLEAENPVGKNDFELLTDENADADYLYRKNNGDFISLDTPRTVKAKGEYALEKGLAGVFSWSADQDDGLLANAAREGMGYPLDGTPTVDMTGLYNPGRSLNLSTSRPSGQKAAAAAGRSVVISDIFYEGKVPVVESDEYVEVSNQGKGPADLSGWCINAGDSTQNFKFPAGTVLKEGQSYRVYTNEVHPETGGFSFGSGRALWNNKGDTGTLFNAEGQQVDEYKYGDHAS